MVRYINERNVVDAADHVGADTEPNDIVDVSPAAPRKKKGFFRRGLGIIGGGIAKGVRNDLRRMGKSIKQGGKIAAQGSKLRSRAWDMKAKADERYNAAIGKSNVTWGKGFRKSLYGRGKQILSPILSEQELLEYGVTDYDLDNYDYFLVEKKTKKLKSGKKWGKAIGGAIGSVGDAAGNAINAVGDTVDNTVSDAVKGGRKVAKVVVRRAKKEYKETKKALKKGYKENLKSAKASFRNAKRNVKSLGKNAAKAYKKVEDKLDDISDDINDHIDDARKELGKVRKAMVSNSAGKRRQTSGLSKEDKAKGAAYRKQLSAKRKENKENSRALRQSAKQRAKELDEAVISELGSLYNSINMIPLVESIMNGEPATTQDIFKDIMNEKLAAAIELYRDASANDLFNEPSDMDDEDFEDAFEDDVEVIAEWTEEGPEDEDEFEDFDEDDEEFIDDEDFVGYEGEELEENMLANLSNPARETFKFGIRKRMDKFHLDQTKEDPSYKFGNLKLEEDEIEALEEKNHFSKKVTKTLNSLFPTVLTVGTAPPGIRFPRRKR